jgi:hypothetical protein
VNPDLPPNWTTLSARHWRKIAPYGYQSVAEMHADLARLKRDTTTRGASGRHDSGSKAGAASSGDAATVAGDSIVRFSGCKWCREAQRGRNPVRLRLPFRPDDQQRGVGAIAAAIVVVAGGIFFWQRPANGLSDKDLI